jgi:ATPase subunit of ABC transporter with duplicated ATPase domains
LEGVQFGNDKSFSLDWRQSALSIFQPSASQKNIKALQTAISNWIILRPNVHTFENESKFESVNVNTDLSNIVSWYRHLAQDQDWTDVLRSSLQMLWPEDIKSLRLSDLGASVKQLELNFSGRLLRFGQLSDGEKMLVALYMIHATLSTTKESLTIMIDEPDNFISIQEMQPWMLEMSEVVDIRRQLIVISHNADILESSPSQIDYFSRDNHSSPTRVRPLIIQEGLTLREILARGWVQV